MMDMFYNYDHDIDPCKVIHKQDCFIKNPVSVTFPTVILNDKGEKLGIRVAKDTDFSLYFNITGEVESEDLYDFLSKVVFKVKVFDFKNNELFELPGYLEENIPSVKVTISALNEVKLEPGVYKLVLGIQTVEEFTMLFDSKNSILEIY